MGIDLPVIWFVIIIFATLMYIVMDGFDLGIGILFFMTRDRPARDQMINSVAPVWDGNETWLVLGGAALFGAFPLAYSVIIDALSIPLTLMLFALIFRGVAFEFRFRGSLAHRSFWDCSFMLGSLAGTFCQGVVVGAFIQGFPVEGRRYAGAAFDWLTPFCLFCGLGLVAAYTLLGCTWLIMKTEHDLQRHMYRLAKPLLLALLTVILVISLWTPLAHPAIARRWLVLPNLFYFLPVPVLVLLCAGWLWRGIKRRADISPFMMTLILIFLGFTGLGISIWPYIIPPSIDIRAASAPAQSQGFMLVGALLIIPVILVYTFWSYFVFRGKINPHEGYH